MHPQQAVDLARALVSRASPRRASPQASRLSYAKAASAAGPAAVHIEDQLLPKKCGHLNDKKLADAHDMAAKVAAARRARRSMLIMARTDAVASEGMEAAVARARKYVEAGADAIFPEALVTAEMFTEFARRLPD